MTEFMQCATPVAKPSTHPHAGRNEIIPRQSSQAAISVSIQS
jgi:hypothetical protein